VTTPEGKVKDAVKKVLGPIRPGLWWYMPVQYGRGVGGVPDFVGCARGTFFAVEAKASGEEPSPLQDLTMNELVGAEATVFVVDRKDSPELDLLRRWLEQRRLHPGE
jgi:hypothetical protein